MKQTLGGANILVTRPLGHAENLCQLIAQQGGNALHLPCLAITAVQPDNTAIQQALDSDYWIFTSRNAVKFAQQAFGGTMPPAANRHIAAVGQATADNLRQLGCQVDCVPDAGYSSEDLLAHPLLNASQLLNQRCCIVRGVGGRELLAEQLQARGAQVSYLEVYQRVLPGNANSSNACKALSEQRLNAVTVTSVETLQNLLLLIDPAMQPDLKQLPLIVVSERIAQAARQQGFTKIIITQLPADTAILQAVMTCLDGENSGRTH